MVLEQLECTDIIIIPDQLYNEFEAYAKQKGIYLTLGFNNRHEGGVEVNNKPLFTNFDEFPKTMDTTEIENQSMTHKLVGKIKDDCVSNLILNYYRE